MPILKCKMCGGSLTVNDESGVAVCEYCGTRQTISKTTDDVISNLYNRANNLRLKNEFDKALNIYEKIVEQDDSEAEAHWGLVLCKYGIEYVDDPNTGKKIPTCHRTSFDSIRSDIDYQAAIDYSSPDQQLLYEEEAREIDRLQKDILNIAKNEKPFDVFICYKETDESGKRTVDSVIANDIYYQLTQEGFKVFYAAITLEDKLGQEYEPYIFAALNSAKVMLAIGTKPEYFNAVWVKNEWSRYLSLMKKDRTKILIPCYRDMDAYDLPDEFAHLQAQDMSKIGFINDVIRGIRKLINNDTSENSPITSSTGSIKNNSAITERAFIFLEDGDFQSADEYFERALDDNPKNAYAYLGKVLLKNKITKPEYLIKLEKEFFEDDNYDKALRFANDKQFQEISGYKEKWIENRYSNLIEQFRNASTYEDFYNVKKLLLDFDFKDTKEEISECDRRMDELKKLSEIELIYKLCQENAWKERMNIVKCVVVFCRDNVEKYPQFKEILNEAETILKEYEPKKRKELENRYDDVCRQLEETFINKNKKEELESQIEQLSSRSRELSTENSMLEAKSKKIGMFGSKQKKQIQDQIQDNQNRFNDYQSKKQELEIELEKYIEYVKRDASLPEEKIKLEKQLKELDNFDISSCSLKNGYNYLLVNLLNENSSLRDLFKFGTYPQNSNVPEFIDWIIVEKADNKCLLLSNNILDYKIYSDMEGCDWEHSSIREWLNGLFLNQTFSVQDQDIISNTNTGKEFDKIFLLSADEVYRYLTRNHISKTSMATKYAVRSLEKTEKYAENMVKWQLRDSQYVDCQGNTISGSNFGVKVGVRPALWIDLSKLYSITI